MWPILAYLVLVLSMSVVAFAAYGWDKACAKSGARRIPESSLHLLSVLGGWPGALWGQRRFRHKTRKISFQVGFWMTVIIHFGMVAALIYQGAFNGSGVSQQVITPLPVITPLRKNAG